MRPEDLEAIGLGLPHRVVRLVRVDDAWAGAAEALITDLRAAMGELAIAIEHVGSTAVPGLLAKPILDIAVQLAPDTSNDDVIERVQAAGWEFFDDSGDSGGLVFVLRARPGERIAHLHVVSHLDPQWNHYLTFRDRLRRDPEARREYEDVKIALAAEFSAASPGRYSDGKDEVVQRLRTS